MSNARTSPSPSPKHGIERWNGGRSNAEQSASRRLDDGSTGPLLLEITRESTVLRVYRRVGRFPGARLVSSGRGLLVMDFRSHELGRIAAALSAIDHLDEAEGRR